ncbi:MAG: hypothetical protein RL347_563 [Actinomycetota bacterium]
MNRRWMRSVSLALAAAVCATGLIGVPVNAKPSPKPGRPCPAVGAEVTKGRWVFTCTLKKGKRVWVRTPKPPAKPTWQIVAEQLHTNSIKRRAASPATDFEFTASPTVSPSVVESVKTVTRWSYGLWYGIAPLPDEYPVLIVDESSEDWLREQANRFPGDQCSPQWWARLRSDPQGLSGAVCSTPRGDWVYLIFYVGSERTGAPDWLALHETVHVAQGQLIGEHVLNAGSECWLVEGMAELYAGALSWSRTTGRFFPSATSAYRSLAVSPLNRIAPTPEEIMSSEFWLDAIRTSEDRTQEACWGTGLGYSLGYLVTEKLVADFGEQRLIDWMRLTGRTEDSDSAFATVFGIDQDAWYERSAAPYVAQEAALILG